MLLRANRKSYMPRRLAQHRMTLSDLELPFHASRTISAVAELLVTRCLRPCMWHRVRETTRRQWRLTQKWRADRSAAQTNVFHCDVLSIDHCSLYQLQQPTTSTIVWRDVTCSAVDVVFCQQQQSNIYKCWFLAQFCITCHKQIHTADLTRHVALPYTLFCHCYLVVFNHTNNRKLVCNTFPALKAGGL